MNDHAMNHHAMKNRGGRPRKLDANKQRRVLRRLTAGDTLAAAARSVGCNERTVQRAAERDVDFRWRLDLALRVSQQLREDRRAEVADHGDGTGRGEPNEPPVEAFAMLRDELARRWSPGNTIAEGASTGDTSVAKNADGGDKTLTLLRVTT